jgi:hypothetical protein
VSADNYPSTDVALGYINGDGNLDAVFANDWQSNRLCLGDGAGGFTCADVSADTNSTWGLALGYINGDGNLDAVFANNNAQPNRICEGDGAGGFTCANVSADANNSLSVALGEVVAGNASVEWDDIADPCEGNNDGTDALYLLLSCETGFCTVVTFLCGTMDNGAKYRVHFDTTAPYFDEMEDDCFTTSDDTAMYRPGPDKLTGPETVDTLFDDAFLGWIFSYEALGISDGDYVAAWLEIHKKGIQDRVPDTDDTDDCAKPQTADEVLEVCAGGICN